MNAPVVPLLSQPFPPAEEKHATQSLFAGRPFLYIQAHNAPEIRPRGHSKSSDEGSLIELPLDLL